MRKLRIALLSVLQNRNIFFYVLIISIFAIFFRLTDSYSIRQAITSTGLRLAILLFGAMLLAYGRIELALIFILPFLLFLLFIGILLSSIHPSFAGNDIVILLSSSLPVLIQSIYTLNGLQAHYTLGSKKPASKLPGILVTGSLMLFAYIAQVFKEGRFTVASITIAVLALISILFVTPSVVSFLFDCLIGRRASRKLFPWTLAGLFISTFAFLYFLVASLVLAIVGSLLTQIRPFGKKRGEYIFHWLISRVCRSLIYIMINVKKNILNTTQEQFDKPAILICNHQSFLDILATIMLSPKLILLTNQWVWQSPFFGSVVRMADYYPVATEGTDKMIEKIAIKIKEGYSVVVFPEGTRSPNGIMQRFHKGAFYLAEKFQLDILPIVIHGTGYTMSKGDFLLKDGTITLQICPRISPVDNRLGITYSEKAKKMGRFFRLEYERLKEHLEQPAFFRERLIYNYLYKGPILEWYVRVKLSLEKDYEIFNDLLPPQGKIIDIGCGYGFLAYMLHFTSPGRQIIGIDYDADKIAVANNCFNKSDKTAFIPADIHTYILEEYDGIVLSDMLHYMGEPYQRILIEKCIKSLKPGGIIVIRDADCKLQKRHRGTIWTEFFSTRLFRFNKTQDGKLTYFSSLFIHQIAADNGLLCQIIDTSKRTSNVIFALRKNSLGPA